MVGIEQCWDVYLKPGAVECRGDLLTTRPGVTALSPKSVEGMREEILAGLGWAFSRDTPTPQSEAESLGVNILGGLIASVLKARYHFRKVSRTFVEDVRDLEEVYPDIHMIADNDPMRFEAIARHNQGQFVIIHLDNTDSIATELERFKRTVRPVVHDRMAALGAKYKDNLLHIPMEAGELAKHRETFGFYE